MTVTSLQENPRTFTLPAAAALTDVKLGAHVCTQQSLSLCPSGCLSDCLSVFPLSASPPLRCASSLLLLDLQGWMMTAVCQPFDSSSSSLPPSPLHLLPPQFLPHQLLPSPCLAPSPYRGCCSPAPTASQRSYFLWWRDQDGLLSGMKTMDVTFIVCRRALPSSCIAGGSRSILNSSLISSSETSFPACHVWNKGEFSRRWCAMKRGRSSHVHQQKICCICGFLAPQILWSNMSWTVWFKQLRAFTKLHPFNSTWLGWRRRASQQKGTCWPTWVQESKHLHSWDISVSDFIFWESSWACECRLMRKQCIGFNLDKRVNSEI